MESTQRTAQVEEIGRQKCCQVSNNKHTAVPANAGKSSDTATFKEEQHDGPKPGSPGSSAKKMWEATSSKGKNVFLCHYLQYHFTLMLGIREI